MFRRNIDVQLIIDTNAGILSPKPPVMGLAKLFDRSSPSWRSIIVVVAASGFALSFLGWEFAHEREDRYARQEFDARANDHFLALQSGINQYINDMLALRAS